MEYKKINSSFSWGVRQFFITNRINKMLETTDLVMKRRGKNLEDQQRGIFKSIYNKKKWIRLGKQKLSND
tara:strand:+ start:1446 stop:1655 length:210 start_codon:yes stop_codon:yes gene_type:complete